MMESNSPGQPAKDQKEGRRERSRSRTRSGLSSRLNFFEYGAQQRQRSPEKPVEMDISSSGLEDSVFDQSEVDQLEREIDERRQRLSRRDDQERRPAVSLRRVVSPVRIESVGPSQPQFATEVYISSWTERVRSPEPKSPPTPPPRDIQPPWRLARRSETVPIPGNDPQTSPFPTPTTPASALSKYQEWRARRLTSVESPEQVAPWRKQRLASRDSKDGLYSSPESRRSSESGWSSPPSNVRKSSQPQWYSEFRTASLSQTASRMDALRTGGIKTHYDFHIAEIKGETGIPEGFLVMTHSAYLFPANSTNSSFFIHFVFLIFFLSFKRHLVHNVRQHDPVNLVM